MHKIKVYKNFLPPNQLDQLYKYSVDNPELYLQYGTEGNAFWNKRTLLLFQDIIPNHIQNIGWDYLNKVSPLIQSIGDGNQIYSDHINFVKWWDGYEQAPHADGEEPNGQPHPFSWRKFGCVYYLNDDYDGGELYFPNFDIEVKPQANMVIFFPGDVLHLHGVRNVSKGVRHTIASFWGYDESHKMKIYDERR